MFSSCDIDTDFYFPKTFKKQKHTSHNNHTRVQHSNADIHEKSKIYIDAEAMLTIEPEFEQWKSYNSNTYNQILGQLITAAICVKQPKAHLCLTP